MIECMLFTASWCAPCQRIKPLFLDLKKEFPDVKVSIKSAEEDEKLSRTYGVRSVPTMIIAEDGVLLKVVANPATYMQMVDAIKSFIK